MKWKSTLSFHCVQRLLRVSILISTRGPFMKETLLTSQLKCLYANAQSMDSKPMELDSTALLES